MKVRILPGGVVQSEVEFHGGDDDGSEWESTGTRQYFKSASEMTAAMKKPEYKTSKSYRDLVKGMIANSDAVALGLAPDRSNARENDYYQQRMATVREMFKDPRYKTDARWREQVRQMCDSPEADQHFPELSQQAVDRKQGGWQIEYTAKETGKVNPKLVDGNGNLKGDE